MEKTTDLSESALFSVLLAPFIYGLLLFLGHHIEIDGTSFFWAANGFLIAILIRQPIYRWLYISMVAAASAYLAYFLIFKQLDLAAQIAAVHLFEALAVSYAISRFTSTPFSLDTTRNLASLIIIGSIIGPCLVAPIAALAHQPLYPDTSFLELSQRWILSHALGNLIMCSALTSLKSKPLTIEPKLGLLGLSLLAAYGVMSVTQELLSLFLYLPIFFWAAFKFGTSVTSVLMLIFFCGSTLSIANGSGPVTKLIQNPAVSIHVSQFLALFAYIPLMVFCVAYQEREKAYRAFSNTLRKNQDLYDKTPVFFYSINKLGQLDSINQFCAQTLGYQPRDLINQSTRILYENPLMACAPGDDLEDDELLIREVNLINHRGQPVFVREYIRQVNDSNGERIMQVAAENISEVQRLSAQLVHQSTHDSLTELFNRETFEQRLIDQLNSVHNGGASAALCLLDLDQFKLVNDTCGHDAGDELLRQLAERLKQCMEPNDVLARLGGDEFGVLLQDCDTTKALMRANQLRDTVGGFQFHWHNQRFSLTTSTGLVVLSSEFKAHTDALAAADAACYTAKEQGRNRLHLYQSDDDQMRRKTEEMRWASQIEMALDEGRLMLYYQTIEEINNPDSTNLHHEILVRMIDTNGDMVPPGVFIPAAEKYGLAPIIDRWVLENTFAFFYQYPNLLEQLSVSSINLSGQTLVDESFPEFVEHCFDTYRVPPHKICFEITETAAIQDINKAQHFIHTLQAMGCLFALDDFGSGLSSFAYLKNLPVDFLKIDGVFVRDIVHDEIDREMVRTINDIGHVTQKKTIAEFVENEEIYNHLREIGVDFAQGWGIAKPRPIIDMVQETVV